MVGDTEATGLVEAASTNAAITQLRQAATSYERYGTGNKRS